MSDDAFHEIQLNGKQLVFLFMAATVVSVVIFLCGVMVGRGVRAERGGADAAAAETAAASSSPERVSPSPPDTQTPAPQTSASNQAQQLPAEAPPTPAEDSGDDVYSQMEKGDTRDTLKTRDTVKKPAPARQKPEPVRQETAQKTAPAPVDSAPPKPAPMKPAAKPDQMPAAAGAYAVQIAALKDRGEADAIARRLVGKGYQAYVLTPVGSRAPMYKVQVGRFKSRQDAERTAARLKKEEQFSPWVTR
jgi:DedD protein